MPALLLLVAPYNTEPAPWQRIEVAPESNTGVVTVGVVVTVCVTVAEGPLQPFAYTEIVEGPLQPAAYVTLAFRHGEMSIRFLLTAS